MLVSNEALLGIALVELGLVIVPGPNMIYLVSRSIAQGRRAGLISLAGVGIGFLVYLLAASAVSAGGAAGSAGQDLLVRLHAAARRTA